MTEHDYPNWVWINCKQRITRNIIPTRKPKNILGMKSIEVVHPDPNSIYNQPVYYFRGTPEELDHYYKLFLIYGKETTTILKDL